MNTEHNIRHGIPLAWYTLGRFAVLVDGVAVPSAAWGTHRALTLCKLLITYRGQPFNREQIQEWIWPDASARSSERNLRVALSELRRVLEPGRPARTLSRFLETSGDSLFLVTDGCWFDADELLRATRYDLADPDACSVLEQAAGLYRGVYLPDDVYAEWSLAERERLALAYETVLVRLAEAYASRADYHAAVLTCRRALVTHPTVEAFTGRLMRYAFLADEPGQALRAYQDLQTALQREYGLEPSPAITAMAERIRSGAPPEPGDGGRTPERPPIEKSPAPEAVRSLPLIDRDVELAELDKAWQELQAGHGRLLLISGPAGIGKSRLAHTMLAWLSARGVLAADTVALPDQGASYGPLLAVLQKLGHNDNLGAALAQVNPQRARLEQEALIWQRLCDVTSDRPVALLLDDLQWADPLTLELLRTIGARLHGVPLLVICCYGTIPASELFQDMVDHGEPAGWLTAFPLEPISRVGLARIARQLVPGSDAARLAERWLAATEGNPLVLTLLLERARQMGHSLEDIGSDLEAGISLPERLQAIIRLRMEACSMRARQMLQLLATIGRPTDVALLQAAWSDGEGKRRPLVALLDAGLITEATTNGVAMYAPSHALVRAMVYDALGPLTRQEWHRRVATALAARPDATPGELARHYIGADEPGPAFAASISAAEAALRHQDYFALRRWAETATELIDRVDAMPRQQFDLLVVQERVQRIAGDRSAQLATFEAMTALLPVLDDDARLQLLFARLEYLYRTNQIDAAIPVAVELREIARSVPDWAAELKAIDYLATFGTMQNRLIEARAIVEAGLAMPQIGDFLIERANLFNDLGQIARREGRMEEAIRCYRQAEIWYREAGMLRNVAPLLNNIGNLAVENGAYADARDALTEAVRIGRQLGLEVDITLWQANLALSLRMLGDFQGALEIYAAVIEAAGAGRYPIAELIARLNRADALLGRDPEGALLDIELGMTLADAAGIAALKAYAGYLRAWVAYEREDPATVELCRTARAELERLGLSGYAASIAVAEAAGYIRRHDLEQASTALQPLLDYVSRRGLVQLDVPMRSVALAVPILRAAGRLEVATNLLAKASCWLKEGAAALTSEAERRRFLQDVPEHAAVVLLAGDSGLR